MNRLSNAKSRLYYERLRNLNSDQIYGMGSLGVVWNSKSNKRKSRPFRLCDVDSYREFGDNGYDSLDNILNDMRINDIVEATKKIKRCKFNNLFDEYDYDYDYDQELPDYIYIIKGYHLA